MGLLPILERLGARRNRAGASGIWTAMAFAAFLLRLYRRHAAREQIALREELKPGEALLITHEQ